MEGSDGSDEDAHVLCRLWQGCGTPDEDAPGEGTGPWLSPG
jgi:hypothetical protein